VNVDAVVSDFDVLLGSNSSPERGGMHHLLQSSGFEPQTLPAYGAREYRGIFMINASRLLSRASAVMLAVAAIPPAFAQNSAAGADDVDLIYTPDANRDETIIVTGTRIRRPDLEALEPRVTLDARYLADRNLTSIADALNETPGFRASITPNGAQGAFGQGVNFVNSLGLGVNRTLTLVNGRRFVSSNIPSLFNQGGVQGTPVDLNAIPAALVERIDTIAVGGAPVYGSDAIAGTVNIILKTRFEGLDLSGTTRVSEQGDAFDYGVSAVWGHDFADGRANLTVAYSHDRQDGLRYNDRATLRANVANLTNPSSAAAAASRPAGIGFANDGRVNTGLGFNNGPADGIPGTILVRDVTLPLFSYGGLITSANPGGAAAILNWKFDEGGALVPFDRGIPFGLNSSGGSRDAFRGSDFQQIRSDLQRDVLYAFGTFDLSPAATLFAEGSYARTRGDELVQQPSFNSSLFGGAGGPLSFDIASPFLTAQARAQLVALGVTSFQISRASLELGDLTGFSTNRLYRGVLGIRGDFQVAGRAFDYEISGNYGRVDVTDVRQDIDTQNFINAINVATDPQGRTVCTTTPATQAAPGGGRPVADPACVPLNLLGYGRADPAALDYVIAETVAKSRIEQTVFNANMGGSLFDLFGNSVGFNVGYEHRREKAAFSPSNFDLLGRGRTVAIAPVSGRYDVDELFGEMIVPLVGPQNAVPFVDRLEVFARGRHVDSSVNGAFFAWAAGGIWAPLPDVQFRGNYTRSFRAPAITELFLPVSNGFTQIPDLCSAANRNAGPAPAVRLRNCTAFLAAFPNATPLDSAIAAVPSRNGGNPSLANEVANSFTYGVLLQPRFLPGLAISADYIRIRIDDPIASLTVAQIASACFDNDEFDLADPAHGNAFCSQIRRYGAGQGGTAVNGGDRGGQVVNDPAAPGVASGYVNGQRINFSGIQGTIAYETSLDALGLPGAIQLDGNMLWVRRRVVDITGVAPSRTDGTIGDPEFSGQLNLRYIGSAAGVSTSINYVGEQLVSRLNRGPSPSDIREIDQLRDYATVNLSTWVDIRQRLRLTLSVTNLFDRQGQGYYGVIIPASTNDLIGRRFALGARMHF